MCQQHTSWLVTFHCSNFISTLVQLLIDFFQSTYHPSKAPTSSLLCPCSLLISSTWLLLRCKPPFCNHLLYSLPFPQRAELVFLLSHLFSMKSSIPLEFYKYLQDKAGMRAVFLWETHLVSSMVGTVCEFPFLQPCFFLSLHSFLLSMPAYF